MNICLGAGTLVFILITTVLIYIRHKKAGSIGWSLFRMVVVAGTLYWGRHAAQTLEIMVLGIIVGACLILSVLHAYNMLFMPGQGYESVGENRRPKSFGNGYWR